jgi:hypothetical protein
MTPLAQLQAVERSMRELLENTALPPPDEVEYREDSLLFRWRERKLAVVIECGEPPPDASPPPPASSVREGGRI